MRVLITRPAADATELAAALRTHGYEILFDPLLTTSEEPGSAAALERSLPGVQAVVFTSPNGVRAFAAASRRRNIPVIALGDATMAAARAAHFGEMESVDGDAEALTSLVVGRLNPLGAGRPLPGGAGPGLQQQGGRGLQERHHRRHGVFLAGNGDSLCEVDRRLRVCRRL